MSFLNSHKFQDRQEAAAKARKAMAEKFLSRPKYDPNDPAVIAREAERRKVLESRVEREKERALRKIEQEAAEAMRKAAEAADQRQEQLRLENSPTRPTRPVGAKRSIASSSRRSSNATRATRRARSARRRSSASLSAGAAKPTFRGRDAEQAA